MGHEGGGVSGHGSCHVPIQILEKSCKTQRNRRVVVVLEVTGELFNGRVRRHDSVMLKIHAVSTAHCALVF